MSHHSIHLHGYTFKVVATDGGDIPAAAQWPEVTVHVPTGSTRTIEFIADGAGARSRIAIGMVIAFGMAIGTMFTLFVTPAVYTMLSRERNARAPAAAATPALDGPEIDRAAE